MFNTNMLRINIIIQIASIISKISVLILYGVFSVEIFTDYEMQNTWVTSKWFSLYVFGNVWH